MDLPSKEEEEYLQTICSSTMSVKGEQNNVFPCRSLLTIGPHKRTKSAQKFLALVKSEKS